MDHWQELRTAYEVARRGTVQAAAAELGIHRATVVRHIDVLEAALGGPLFHRHRKGYAVTEAGQDLLRVAGAAADEFDQLAGRTRGRAGVLEGEVTVTSFALIAPLVLDAVEAFRTEYPGVRVHFEVASRVLRLEHGEAHVSLRAGTRPSEPDAVAVPLPPLRTGLYAHPRYLAGCDSALDLADHTFVVDEGSATVARWLQQAVPGATVGLACSDTRTVLEGVERGLGVGFFPAFLAARRGLVAVRAPDPAWDVPLWLVSTVAWRRTARVQALWAALRTAGAALVEP